MLNPILYMVNVFRYGFLGVSDIPVGWALAAIAAFITVLFAIALWMLERGKGIAHDHDRPETLAEAPLGQESSYPEHYDAGLLYPIARAANRAPLGIHQ